MADDVVQNEQGTAATSILSGAESIAIQDLDICGPLHYVEHCECFFFLGAIDGSPDRYMFLVTILSDPAAYYLAYDALTHSGPASPARFNHKFCNYFTNNTLLTYSPTIAKNIVIGALRIFTGVDSPGGRSLVESPLKVSPHKRAMYDRRTHADMIV